MDVIITVPHSKCISPAAERTCDLRAKTIATKIYKKLRKLPSNKFNISIHFADTVRDMGDLNRCVTRNWAWRKLLQAQIESSLKNRRKTLVLDIHSFPNTTESFGIDEDTKKIPHIVLLDFEKRYSYVKLPNTTIMQGAYSNDIMLQTIRAGGEALLLEFNEDANYTSNKLIDNFIENLNKLVLQSNEQ